jgi:hypothetical protein
MLVDIELRERLALYCLVTKQRPETAFARASVLQEMMRNL